MKKIALLISAMVLCAGIAMAQEPAKKATNDKAKATTTQTVKTDNTKAATPAKTEACKATQEKHCGNCPHHKQVAANPQAKPEAKGAAQKDCQKQCQKQCNKEAAATKNDKKTPNATTATK